MEWKNSLDQQYLKNLTGLQLPAVAAFLSSKTKTGTKSTASRPIEM